jgi:hypothetical protein
MNLFSAIKAVGTLMAFGSTPSYSNGRRDTQKSGIPQLQQPVFQFAYFSIGRQELVKKIVPY